MPSLSQVRDTIKRNASEISSLQERQATLEKEMKEVKDKLSKLSSEQNRLKAEAFDLLEQSQREADAAEKRPPLVKKPSRYSIGSNGSVISSSSGLARSTSASVIATSSFNSSSAPSQVSVPRSAASAVSSVGSASSAVSSASRVSASTAASSVQSSASKASSEGHLRVEKKVVAEDAKSILLPNPWESQRPRQALRTASSHASFTTRTEISATSSSSSSSDNPIYAGPPIRNTADEHDPTHIAPYYPASVLQQRTLSLPACAWLSEQWDLQYIRPPTRSSSPASSSSFSDKDDERTLPPLFVALADRMWAQTKWRYLTDEIRRAWEAGQWRFRLAPHQVGGPPFGRDWTPRAEENWERRQNVLDRLRKMGHLKDLPKQ